MRTIIRGIVALVAAFCMMDAAQAAPTIVSPADYSTVDTITEELKTFLWSDAMKDVKTFTYTAVDSDGNYVVPDSRKEYMADYRSNFKSVKLQWTGSGDHSGSYTVSVKRAKDNKEVLAVETSDTSVDFTAPENGRNYIWTVTDNTGTATGHFFTERYNGSRIINTSASAVSNMRDIGGWETEDGKVVKQGLIYRSASLEWTGINADDKENAYFEIPYLRDTLGIRYEIDLRERSDVSSLLGKSYWYGAGALKESTIDPSIPRFFCEDVLGSSISFPAYTAIDNTNNKKALWVTFTNFCDVVKSDGTVRPTLVHCSHGKDRTGVIVYTLLGVLGVPQDSLDREWALSWYAEGKYDVYMNTQTAANFTSATNRKWFLSDYTSDVNSRSGSTLKEKCYNVLLECAKAVDSSDAHTAKAKTLIDNYVSVMLEEPEVAAVDPSKVTAPVAVTGLVYNGSELTGVAAGTGYTLTGNTAVDAGNHTAVATLVEGYKWADGTTGNKEISWSIAKATNEWTTEPSISLTEWTQGEEAGVLTAGVAKFGEVTSSMTELPTEVGSYTITYTVAENNNYNGLTKTISFEIKAAVVVEPDPEEPGTGGEEPSEKPKLTIDDKFGYILTGLGELKDQAAVVFTNSAEIATWTAPGNLKNVEFLAVGGGGGGGVHYYSSTVKNRQGGAGGGGGAVVTGYIKELSEEAIVSIKVGKGGTNCVYSSGSTKKATHGGNSTIKVGELNYITAYGGGGDGGKDSAGVGIGGSNSGARKNLAAADLVPVNAIGEGAENLVSDVVSRAHKGGSGYYAGSSGYPAAGGGGAGGEGGSTGDSSSSAAAGGAGYESFITDVGVIYGAGGAGGYGKSGTAGSGTKRLGGGREDSGAGHSDFNKNGTDAAANRGGGGGGGSYQKAGGDGGSGVVILRFAYSETEISVDASTLILPKISDKVYTGDVLSSGLVETYAYTVEELTECVNVGAKVVRATLNEGYVWADGTTERYKDFAWNILKQENNVWVTSPYIHVDSWPQAFANSVVFNRAVPLAGELIATIAKDNGENKTFDGNLPTEPGTYKLIYKVENTSNQSPLYWEKTFTVYPSETIEGGYKVSGLGENGDEVAVVFTSSANWTVPQNIYNAQFLVVGGGGGGGADTGTSGEYQGGAGGGGGGVITGVIKALDANSAVTVTVGAGGKAGDNGIPNSGYGAGSTGGASTIALGTTTIVTAKGGGRDAGAAALGKYADGKDGDAGGSGGGGRPNKAGGAADAGTVNEAYVENVLKYANVGGAGCTVDNYGYGCGAAGGGGGATEVGGNGTKGDEYKGGNGGEGLASDITGTLLVYGSGGGGSSTWGSAGVGGIGAGDGVYAGKGEDALANQGGGGGGGSRNGDGGNGGSGIVVFRYVSTHIDNFIFADEIESAVNASINGSSFIYNGQNQTPLSEELLNSEKYVISGDAVAREAGTYTFTVTPNEGYAWDDETRASKEFTWSIQKIDPSYGYIKEIGDEVVVVFTNHTVVSSWTVPYNIYNAQFLVVGGGGGGGGDVTVDMNESLQGGGGGGGGGVITGMVNFAVNSRVSVVVGAGGLGGTASQKGLEGGYGAAATAAGASRFSVFDDEYAVAYGGGSDLGSPAQSGTGGKIGGSGGSSAGSRPGATAPGHDSVLSGWVNPDESNIIFYAVFGNKGGAGSLKAEYGTYFCAGGGGGALTSGGDGVPPWDATGGDGGHGLTNSITGVTLVYGSGGGGGTIGWEASGGKGGSGAGDGAQATYSVGKNIGGNGAPNQGGGGGGGGRSSNGGNGGSGIVVFRFSKVNHTIGLPDVDNATWWYNGVEVSSSVQVGAGSNAKFILKADKGYVIVEGEEKSTEKTFTCESVKSDITVSVDGVSVEALPVIAEIDGVEYTSFEDAVNAAVDGDVIYLLGDVELLNDLVIDKTVTFALGDCTVIVPSGKTITIAEGCEVTISCASGGLAVDGIIAVNGTLDVSELSYGTSGLIAGKAGSLAISSTGKVKLMSDWNSVSPNWMMANNGAFFNGTVSGAQLVQGDATYTYANGFWATCDDVAMTTIESNGYTFTESFNSLSAALAAAQPSGTVTLLRDVTGVGVVIEKSITIDLNDKVYAFESGLGDDEKCGFEIPAANTVTLKNGTLEISESAADSFYAVVKNSADLTLQDVIIGATDAEGDLYAVSNDGGNLKVEGSFKLGKIMFTSGSVKGDVEDALVIPEELKLALDENGAYVLVAKDVLAAVGDKLFETLSEAAAASKSGDAILLKKNVTVEESVQIPAGVTFNLNGYTVDVKASLIINGTLSGAGTINLSSLEATVTGAQGLNVVSIIENYKVVYNNGVYSLEEIPAEFAAQVGTTKYTNLTAAFAALKNAGNLNNVTVQLIANSKEDVEVPAGFKGTIDLGGYTLRGAIGTDGTASKRVELIIENGYIRLEGRSEMAAIGGRYCTFVLNNLNLYTDCHGVILDDNATCIVNSGTYVIGDKYGNRLFYLFNKSNDDARKLAALFNVSFTPDKCTAALTINGGSFSRVDVGNNESYAIQVSGMVTDPIVNVYGGEFLGFEAAFNLGTSGSSYCNVYGGKYTGTIEVGTGNPTISGGWFNRNPANYVASGYCAVSTTANNKGPWTVVPYPEKDNGAGYEAEYTAAAAMALYENSTRSVAVKVNGEVKKGDSAINAINDAVACFEDAISFNENAADLNVAIEVTEVNTEDPAASTVVVKRGDTGAPITLKKTPTAKYFYPETDSWDSVKPETGAVIFKIVFEK